MIAPVAPASYVAAMRASRRNRERRRQIPSVDALLRELGEFDIPRNALVALMRKELAEVRQSGEQQQDREAILDRVRKSVEAFARSRIQPVINATGVLIHTNLGRAPLGDPVIDALKSVAANYNNLEFNLTDGQRGGRAAYLEHNLAVLCGAEAATVVNNGAAALVLILRHFISDAKPQVLISRGELVQIGGGFRIPEILEASGAKLREVGTTNKTTVSDYARALSKQAAMVLKVHRSNFFMDGFVESPETGDLAKLCKSRSVSLIEDLGSGATFRTESIPGLQHEPTAAEVLKAGVELACFSGDKLLGGPQAGIIAGRAKLVAALKRNPFFRALRCDKLILGALQETVDLHLRSAEASAPVPADSSVPILAMLNSSIDEMMLRADRLVAQLKDSPVEVSVGTGKGQLGGGTLPRSKIPSVTLDLVPRIVSVTQLAQRLHTTKPPVIGYISAGRLRLDLRTIFPRQDAELLLALRAALMLPIHMT